MSTLPSCLTMVNRVLEDSGDLAVASLNPGNKRSKIVLEAMNDACSEIWMRERWPWQRYTAYIPLVASVSDYPLPADFGRLDLPVGFSASGSVWYLQEFTPEEWSVWQAAPAVMLGTPQRFKLNNVTLSIQGAPTADFITTYPHAILSYFKDIPARRTISDGASSWDLPGDFYDCMIRYGKARLKQFLEFPDYQQDVQLYEQALRILQNKVRQGRKPAGIRPQFPVIAEW